ncbi:MAG: tetratricopeptide repeat protein, partial [Hyphomicrobiaceae bacterium]|nr:tetratricopeptide repeat protein [Hyphomicrobiaceae bacterium]
APWCGPCKDLAPRLEAAIARAGGKVRLAKMNTDEHPAVAGQLGIRSLPTIVAFIGGQPASALTGAQPDSELKRFIDSLLQDEGPSEEDRVVEMGEAALDAGDAATAAQAFASVLQVNRENLKALGGMARAYLKLGDADKARQILALVPEKERGKPEIAAATAALDLAEQMAGLGNPDALKARLDSDAEDHQARFDLALIANASGDKDAAVDQLIEIVRRQRDWNEDGARKQLLTFFEAWGPKEPAVARGRRKLASVLW